MIAGNYRRLAAAGAASGLAYWIRPEGLEVALVALPVLAWHGWRAGWPWRRWALATGTLATSALLVAAPYMALSGKITSKQLQFFKVAPAPTYITQLASQPAQSSAPPAASPSAPAPPPAPPQPRYAPSLVLKVVGLSLAAFINSICQGFKFIFLPLYLLGLVALVWRRPPAIQVAFLSLLGAAHIAILMGVYVFSGYIAHRHVIPLVGLAMPFAALGTVQTGAVLARWTRTRPVSCTAVTLGIACALVLPYTLRRLNREFLPVIEATDWVEAHAASGTGVVCNSPYVEFYGTHPVTILGPDGNTLDEALARAPAAARYEFVVLHVNAHGYREEWVGQIEQSYRQVLELIDPYPHTKPRKVLVFQARDAAVRNAAR
jgi:hypothetical protein